MMMKMMFVSVAFIHFLISNMFHITFMIFVFIYSIGFSVENAYLDEKEEAILALRLLAEFTG